MSPRPVTTAVVGSGMISSIYLENMRRWSILDVVACADLDFDRAQQQATRYGVPRAAEVADVLADPEIELIVNLTIPAAHGTVGLAALRSGKSVYNEKPLTISRDDARLMLTEAHERGLLVGCAPDTFLGGGLQTCRQLLDEGAIGTPVAATAFMMSHGPEKWHSNPAFFYDVGGGPMFDMGPYYLTALINMLGPVRRVTGSARISQSERTIGSQPLAGTKIPVRTPTHLAAVLDFASGPIGTLVTSFDVWHAQVPRIEIYGTTGSLSLPDPNTFGGPVRLRGEDDSEWRDMPLSHGWQENSRGLGVADLAYALRNKRPARASGALAYHVLDIMHAIHDASDSDTHVTLDSQCERPAALPTDLPPNELDQ